VIHDIPELINRAAKARTGPVRMLVDTAKDYFRVRALKRARIVVCNSHFIIGEVCRRYAICVDRIRLGYCGVDERFYAKGGPSAREGGRGSAGWKGYILCFATGDPRESFGLYPEICERIRKTQKDIGLIVAGVAPGAPYARALKIEFTRRGLGEERDFLFLP